MQLMKGMGHAPTSSFATKSLIALAIVAVAASATADVELYNNGPMITHVGAGAGGANVSALQTNLGLDNYGSSASSNITPATKLADNFTVTDPNGWYLRSIDLFGYQTNSGLTPSITGVTYRVLNGPPDSGSSTVVIDRSTGNSLVSAVFSNIYRANITTLTNAARPIFELNVDNPDGTLLPPGTYWIEYTMTGSASFSGPWSPYVTTLGQTGKAGADGKQYFNGAWTALVDDGFPDGSINAPQDVPFALFGLPGTATIGGTITFTGHDPNFPLPATVSMDIRTFGTQTVLRTVNASIGSGGTFSFTTNPVGRGVYDLSLKPTHWLRKTVTFNTSNGDDTNISIVLVNGDIVNNNEVDLADYSALAAAFGSIDGDPNWNAMADLNDDGEVSLPDYNILAGSFGQIGDD